MGKKTRREQEQKRKQESKQGLKRSFMDMLPPDWKALAAILLLGLALRISFALSYDATLYDQAGEGVRYIGQVREGPVDASSPPLYIMFLRTCLGIFGRGVAKAVSVIMGALGAVSVALIYYIAREISDRTTAVIAAAISAVYMNYIMAGLALSPRVPGILAVLTVTLIILRAKDGNRGNGLAGAVLGLGILVDPYLLLFAPGFLLVSRRRLYFTAALVIVLMPWTIRNSAREGILLPVYSPVALELDLSRWMTKGLVDFYHLVDRLYVNGSNLLSRGAGWTGPSGSIADANIQSSSLLGDYLYVLVTLVGLVGLLKYRSREHGLLLYPALIYLGLLAALSTCRNSNRLLAEHMMIFYTAVLLSRIYVRLKSRYSAAAENSPI